MKKVTVHLSFEKNQRISAYLISDGGRVYRTLLEIKTQDTSLKPNYDLINNLIWTRGFIHIWPIDKFTFVSLRPDLVNSTTMTTAVDTIAGLRPERVFISIDVENKEWEHFSSVDCALIRIERLCGRVREG